MSDAVVNGLAGAGGGIVAVLLTYPLQAVSAISSGFLTILCEFGDLLILHFKFSV
jgi:hypothetical protein